MYRYLSFLLAVLIVLGTIGCSPTTPAAPTAEVAEPGSPTLESTETAAPSTEEVSDKEPVTLSFWAGNNAGNYEDGIQSDPVAKYIEERTGITVDWVLKPEEEKLATLMASRNLPDIVVVPWTMTQQMIDAGLIIDMHELLETRGQDIKANLAPASLKYSYDVLSGDTGKLYYIPLEAYAPEASNAPATKWGGVYTRWDYYKELGYPELKNYDDYLNLVAAMKEAHPVNEDGLPYHGFSLWFDWGPFIQTDVMTREDMGVETLEIGIDAMEFDRMTLEPYNRYLREDSAFWRGVEFWYKANQMGLLDPDSFTQTYDMAMAKYDSDQVLASMIQWPSPNGFYEAKGVFDKGFFGPLPIDGSRGCYYDGWITGNESAIAISANSEHPERAMDLLNWLNSKEGLMTVANGIEGVDWVQEGDTYRFTEEYRKKAAEPEAANKYGYGKYLKTLSVVPNSYMPGTEQPYAIAASRAYQIEDLQDPSNIMIQEAVKHFGVELPGDIRPKGQECEVARSPYLKAYLPVDIHDEEVKLLDYQMQNYLQSAVVQIINAKDDADFAAQKEKIMSDLKNMGVDRVYGYWANLVEEARAKMAE